MIPSRWFVAAGAALALVGLVLLVWYQVDLGRYDLSGRSEALTRLESAVSPLTLVALGVLVVIGAELLDVARSGER